MTTGPEAGWYDDGTGRQRWWDGARWTEHYVDLRERDVELHSDAVAGAPTTPGWYDDGRGRRRWWDGVRWTDATSYSGEERALAGIVVDGRWIHFGALSHPVGGATASYVSGAELVERGRLTAPAIAQTLFGPAGAITPRLLKRTVDPRAGYLLVEVAGQTWLAPVAAGAEPQARSFAAWIGTVAEHYRYG